MPAPTVAREFLELLEKSGLLQPDALARIHAELSNLPPEPAKLATVLVKRGLLSKLQARLLLSGKYKGFIIGPYVIRDEIGKGGMGAVYLAEHRSLRRQVALKVLLGDKVNQPGAVDRFFREARAAAALDHSNIVRVFDVGQQGDSYYLVMDYVPGTTLDKIQEKESTLPYARAADYIAQAAAGLQHAAEKGFVHRDIKPANLMVTPDGIVKILDMGLARSLCKTDDVTGIKDRDAILGTADYVSPEQALGNADLDIRSDIYSLGATFYTLLMGHPPFPGNVAQKLIHHQQTPVPRPSAADPAIPEGVSDIVVRMMAKRREDRFQSPLELMIALSSWLSAGNPMLTALSNAALVGADSAADLLSGPATHRGLRPGAVGSSVVSIPIPRTPTGSISAITPHPTHSVSVSEIELAEPPDDLYTQPVETVPRAPTARRKPILIGVGILVVLVVAAVMALVI
ncbi:MAG: serine/threonine protein kinase [Bacteroidales bacterium]|nr:serine/threonine protein kinase [Bacteroidales bacterium]